MKNNNILSLTISIFLFIGCNNTELDILKKQNQELRDSLKIIRNMQPIYMYQSRTFAKKDNIKLGETYEAEAFICIERNLEPTRVLRCDVVNDKLIRTKDTLAYDSYYASSVYKVTPKDTGFYKWGGIILLKEYDKIIEYPFMKQYHVSK